MFRTRNKSTGSLENFQNRMLNQSTVASNAIVQMASTSASFKSPVSPSVNTNTKSGVPFFVCGRARCGSDAVAGS